MDNSSFGRLNYHFRLRRREELVQRLREHFGTGKASEKVPVTATRTFLESFGIKLSKVECGLIVKRAFPEVQRQRSNSKWYYYGLKHIDGKEAGTTLLDSGNVCCKPSNPQKGATVAEHQCETTTQAACSYEFIDQQAVLSQNGLQKDKNTCTTKHVCSNVSVNQPVDLSKKFVHSSEIQPRQQSYFRPFSIPSLNLCQEDMSDLTQELLIGEGTFGKCIAGTYKGVSAAFKIFKDLQCYEEVHAEANMLLKIPSHPGIPMLIGVCTTNTPFVLATKLCKTAGKPETYSSFLKSQQEHSKPNLGLALHLLLSVGEALSHIFSVGILHNDVKGNNVVLEDAHGVKRGVLIDFGKACYVENAKESVRHRLMNFNERRQYRERFPHVAPELSCGEKPTQSTDVYSFGHMYCLTMKEMKNVLGAKGKELLELGKQLSHFRPQKRPKIAVALKELASFSSAYSL